MGGVAPADPRRPSDLSRARRPRAPALPLALLAPALGLLLAGCAGGDGGGGEDGPSASVSRGDGAEGTVPMLEKPAWAVGDAWTYDVNGEATTYVVASETDTDWILETDSAERAFADRREDISRLGPQRKSDLAGSQGETRVEFFRWPLLEGETWPTTWDGQAVTITVEAIDPVRGSGWADLTATDAEGRVVYRYSYSVDGRWFTDLRRYDPDGREAVALLLRSAVHDWTGTLVRWELQQPFGGSGNGSAPLAASGTFEVPAGATDLWLEYHFTCTGSGGFTVLVEPLNPGLADQRMEDSGPCVQVDWAGPVVDGPHPGTWAFFANAGAQTLQYSYALLVRTRIDVPFPAA